MHVPIHCSFINEGWGEWSKIAKLMIKSRDRSQTWAHAQKMEKKHPEMREFFSPTQIAKMHETYEDAVVTRLGGDEEDVIVDDTPVAEPPKALSNLSLAALELMEEEERNDDDSVTSTESEASTLKNPTLPSRLNREVYNSGKASICIGNQVIETDTSLPPPTDTTKPADDIIFDPKYRPSAPTVTTNQIYIPGSRVFARWSNKNDPWSYGTWYPGYIQASKLVSDSARDIEVSSFLDLIYHVRFDDGVLAKDVTPEDIMTKDQFETWLQQLEDYYALPVTPEIIKSCRIRKGKRVYAQWNDPTDPDLHARWVPGTVHEVYQAEVGRGRVAYHVQFENGEEDDDLKQEFVLEESVYKDMLKEKIKAGTTRPDISGIDLITAASKIASPVKMPTKLDGSVIANIEKKDFDDDDSFASIEDQLFCNEELESRPPSPKLVSTSPEPELHYGIYMKTKPRQISPVSTPRHIAAPQDAPLPSQYIQDTSMAAKLLMNKTTVKTNGGAAPEAMESDI